MGSTGTGFLECLSCGIPTMIMWNRLFSEEMDYAAPDFKELENVGVVHSTVQSLCIEYKKYINNPNAWIGNSARSAVVDKFVSKYALLNDGWESDWLSYLKQFKY